MDIFLDSVIEAIDERDRLIDDLRSVPVRIGFSEADSYSTADSVEESSSIQNVTTLLSLAERTAERHVADAQKAAEEAVRAAELRAK